MNPADIAKRRLSSIPIKTRFNVLSNSCPASFNTPSNQRLIFEYASGGCAFPSGGKLTQVVITTQAGGVGVSHRLGITDHTGVADITGGAIEVPFGQVVRIYADPNTAVGISAFGPTGSNNDSHACVFIVSGQAVDVP